MTRRQRRRRRIWANKVRRAVMWAARTGATVVTLPCGPRTRWLVAKPYLHLPVRFAPGSTFSPRP
jgi:hypothetical protein